MNKSDFTALLEQPHLAYQESYEQLEQMLVEYPYCQNVRVLLLKKYKADDSHRFEDHLRLAAANAPDRVALYKFLNGTPAKILEIKPIEADAPQAEREEEAVVATDKEQTKELEVELNLETAPVPEEELEPVVAIEERPLQVPPPAELETVQEDIEMPASMDDMRDAPVEEIDDAGSHQDDNTPEEDEEEEAPILHQSVPAPLRVPETPEPSRGDFAEWLLHFQPPRLGEAMPIAPLKKIGTTEKVVARVTKWENPLSGIPEPEKTYAANRDKIEKLLDESSLPREEIDFTQVQELADKSITDNDEVVSETLAKLLAMQGKKEKAIHMYEKLSLLFPEKCRFFADQIEKIRLL